MPIPDSIQVKLISDAAGMVAITPVVVQEMTAQEVLDLIVGKLGKQRDRVRNTLRAGTLVRGGSRYRWEGLDPTPEELDELLAAFPDPDPERVFREDLCSLVVMRFQSGQSVELEPEALARHKLLRPSFWEALCDLVRESPPTYEDYSHQERADRFRLRPDRQALATIDKAAALLVHHQLANRLLAQDLTAIDFFLPRPNS